MLSPGPPAVPSLGRRRVEKTAPLPLLRLLGRDRRDPPCSHSSRPFCKYYKTKPRDFGLSTSAKQSSSFRSAPVNTCARKEESTTTITREAPMVNAGMRSEAARTSRTGQLSWVICCFWAEDQFPLRQIWKGLSFQVLKVSPWQNLSNRTRSSLSSSCRRAPHFSAQEYYMYQNICEITTMHSPFWSGRNG